MQLTSRKSFLRMTKKPIRSRVSLVKMRSASVPHMSSAAARMAGATTSRVVFINSSASHSKTFWIICGFGFCKSCTLNLIPMSVMQPAISLSGCVFISNGLLERPVGAYQSHEGIVFVGSGSSLVR